MSKISEPITLLIAFAIMLMVGIYIGMEAGIRSNAEPSEIDYDIVVTPDSGPISSMQRTCTDLNSKDFKCMWRIGFRDGNECYITRDASVCLSRMRDTEWLEED